MIRDFTIQANLIYHYVGSIDVGVLESERPVVDLSMYLHSKFIVILKQCSVEPAAFGEASAVKKLQQGAKQISYFLPVRGEIFPHLEDAFVAMT